MRNKLFNIIEPADEKETVLSAIYDIIMIIAIVISIIPLAFKKTYHAFIIIEYVCLGIFILDYVLRWFTADFKYPKRKKILAFIIYPITFMALIDLASILPSITAMNNGFKILRVLRLLRAIRVIRIFKIVRYSKNIQILGNVFKNTKDELIAVGTLAVGYILTASLVIFTVEPDSFKTYFDAIYWATVSLTTVGYGDIYPVTVAGRIVTMLSSVFGIAIIALPSGIITAGYMKELNMLKAAEYINEKKDEEIK